MTQCCFASCTKKSTSTRVFYRSCCGVILQVSPACDAHPEEALRPTPCTKCHQTNPIKSYRRREA